MTAFSLRQMMLPGAAGVSPGPGAATDFQDALLPAVSLPSSTVWLRQLAGVFILAAVVIAALLIAVVLTSSLFYHTNILRFGEYGIARHLDGTAYRPFVYRVFTDLSARLVLALHLTQFPLPYLDQIVATTCPAQRAIPAATCEQEKAYVIVATVFAWGFLISTYLLALRFVGGVFWAAATTLLAAFIVNSLLLQTFGQPYDFTTLFFATTLFLFAAQQRDLAFAVLLAVGCLAKESFGFFVIIFALIGYGQRPLRQVLRNLCLQGVIFVALYESERLWFTGNGGASMYHNLPGHLKFLVDNTTVYSLAAALLFCILLCYRLPQKPAVLRRAMLILPVMLVLYFAGGQPGEFRIIVDVFPIVLLPIADSLRRLCTGTDHADVAAYRWPERTRVLTP